MDEPKPLDGLFKEKIFRIPDYQHGFAWQKNQLKDFWEDLINLSEDRNHYMGVLTLKQVSSSELKETDNEYWLIEDHSYKLYHIVDGQQRLTTFVVLLQAFIDIVRQLAENNGKGDQEIFITESLTLADIVNRYLFKTKPPGIQGRTYKFGYSVDNPSYEYLRYKIFDENAAPSVEETFYTLNLKNARRYFYEQLKILHRANLEIEGLRDIYRKLTKRFLFNEYVIKDEFDVFVAFETMNNRGKRLSDLELLKNRLIYLTTLYPDDKIDAAEHRSLREAINQTWMQVYYQLGRNSKRPLNDDEFLKAHWIMYFQFSRKKGNDYIKFLLDEQFSPQKIYGETETKITLDLPEEQPTDFEMENADIENSFERKSLEDDYVNFVNSEITSGRVYLKAIKDLEEKIQERILGEYSLNQLEEMKNRLSNNGDLHGFNVETSNRAPSAAIGKLIDFIKTKGEHERVFLKPCEIRTYVDSLKESAVHWFNSYYPHLATDLSEEEKSAVDQLNRIGVGYFRPLLMSVFKNEKDSKKRIALFKQIERFIFIVFRLSQTRSNYRDSEFYNAARELNRGNLSLKEIKQKLDDAAKVYFLQDKTLNSDYFRLYLDKRFKNGDESGYYGWNGLRYFLYEYELHLLSQTRQKKVLWEDLFTTKDRVSIEHIFPQTPTKNWKQSFASVEENDYRLYSGSIGNLLLLAMSVNASLQNDDFCDKKNPKLNAAGDKIRNGYSDGSHSEIEVAQNQEWKPDNIEKRGLQLLTFMEKRWDFKFADDQTKKSLLFLKTDND